MSNEQIEREKVTLKYQSHEKFKGEQVTLKCHQHEQIGRGTGDLLLSLSWTNRGRNKWPLNVTHKNKPKQKSDP